MIRQRAPQSYSVERQLAHSEERLDLLIESVTDYAIFMLDPVGHTSTWNLGAHRIYGYTEEEILGKHVSIFYLPEDIESAKADDELKTAMTEGRFEEEGWRVRKDGSRFWASVILTPVEEDGVLRGFAKVVRDITHRMEAERSEQRFRLLVESVEEYAIFMLDTEGRISSWNPGAERINGYSESEILGRHFSIFYPEEEVESGKPDRELVIALEEGKYEEEGWRVRKDGRRFWSSVVITPVRDSQGTLQGFSKVTRDMTHRREMEEQLRDLNRELEVFAYSVAHDLRGPLRSIMFTSRMLLDDADPALSDEAREMLRAQYQYAGKLARVVSDILALSRIKRAEIKMENIDLSSLAREVTEDVAQKTGTDCQIEIQDHLEARGDRTLLRAVLQNLIENACKFSPRGGKVFVGREKVNGEGVFVVRDQGIGFAMEYATKVFQPFERLVRDEEFEGTGVGLANVQWAVARHGGKVWVESEPGKGSSFYFTLRERGV